MEFPCSHAATWGGGKATADLLLAKQVFPATISQYPTHNCSHVPCPRGVLKVLT